MTKNWKLGDSTVSPVEKMISLNPEEIGPKQTYKLMIGSILPRPIAFVSTVNEEGVGNLAPFSFFNGIASNPPTLMISITRKSDGSKKDTLRNIEQNGQFVVNTVHEWMIGPVNQCSAEFPYGVDEMKKVGLTPIPSQKIKPPRVKESAIQFECELYRSLEIGDGTEGSSTLIVGKILFIHVFDQAYRDGKIVFDVLKPVTRLGGLAYGLTSDTFSLPRP